jgi:predicted extracellular nuclease
VTFDIATADDTATTADNDYAAKSLTSQTIAEGSSTYTFDVLVNGDTTDEPDETFFVNVTNVTGANVADGQGQGTIQNDDAVSPPPVTGVVISQVYGGGGNSGATFKNDFVELYNTSATAVDLTGWTVQYTSATGTSWTNKTALSGIIEAGHYYLVREAAGTSCSGGPCGVDLPASDATGTIAMAAGSGKVALVSDSTSLSGTGCPFAASVVDFVGYGSANCSEGSPAPTLSNTTADIRNGNVDTNNNSADFSAGTPTPHNSSTNPFAYGSANPNTVLAGNSTLLTVTVIPGYLPDSTGIVVTCDLSSIGGSATQAFYDDGSNGDAVANNNTFSFSAAVASNTTGGTKNLACTIHDNQARTASATISLSVTGITPIGTVNGAVQNDEDATKHRSPFAPADGNGTGDTVIVQGVIYEKTLQATDSTDTYKGFFLQNTAATADGDPNTSDGIFVFMNTFTSLIGGYTPQVGDEVVISAKVQEYYFMTELSSATALKVVRSGVDINAEVAPVVANPPVSLADANRYWERLQGMRIQVPQNSIVLGGRNVFSPADAEIWLARSDSTIAQRSDPYTRRAFRDAHPLDDNYDAQNWDGNGYRMLIGSLGIKDAASDAQALIDPARTFDTLTNSPAGGLNYTFNKYRIEISEQPTFAEGVDPAANHAPQTPDRPTEYSIVDYNVENLYDYRDNPVSGCDFTGDSGCPATGPFISAVSPPYDYVPDSNEAYQARIADIATQIIDVLHAPDILMMQEVENQDICSVSGGSLVCGSADNADGKPDDLQDLALKIAELGGPAYDAAFDRDSSDLRGILPAFMYRTDRVQLLDPTGDPILGGNPDINYAGDPVPHNSDISNPKTLNAVLPAGVSSTGCETEWVFPRAPDIGLFRVYTNSVGDQTYRDVYVIDNHFKSGPDSCQPNRREQAKYNAAIVTYLQSVKPNASIVLGGDLNVYARPDDTTPPSNQLAALYDSSLGLKNLYEVELANAPEATYSYVYQGMAQTIDQIFVNQPSLAHLSDVRTAHVNSDFPADYPGDVARGTSDHDPTAARFLFNLPPVANPDSFTVPKNGSDVVYALANDTDPEGDSFTVTSYSQGAHGTVKYSEKNNNFRYTPDKGFSGTDTFTYTITDAFGGTATGTVTVTVQ